jgi:hypothetical protein
VSSILVAAVALLAAVPAFASPIVYQQPAQSPVVSTRSSQDQTGGGIDFQTWDNFVLTSDMLIDGVDWQGSYFNIRVNDANFNPPANSTGFVVQFYSDSLGTPGSLLASQTFTPAAANETFVGQQPFAAIPGLGLGIYNYSAALSTAFLATSGTPYWLSVYALSPLSSATEAQWGWNGGTGGDGSSPQAIAGVIGAPTPPDRTFALHGTAAPIPEPATMLLFGSGLAGIAARARARRRNRK